MRLHAVMLRVVCLSLVVLAAGRGAAQTLYSQNFDVDDSPNWRMNTASPTNEHAEFFFDYSSVGIPAAPHSAGGSTRGMKLYANTDTAPSSGAAGGVSVSPIGKSFTGNYSLRFDLWSNFVGDPEDADSNALRYGILGSSHFSLYGILAKEIAAGGADPASANYMTGTFASTDTALYFSNSTDGQTAFDYRVHAPGRAGGFRANVETTSATVANRYDPVLDAGVSFADVYPATWPSGTLIGQPHPDAGKTNRGVSDDDDSAAGNQPDGFLYINSFPAVPIATSAPNQGTMFPATQFGSTMEGAMGMAWRDVEIKKVGNIVTWSVLNAEIDPNTHATGPVVLATVNVSQLNPTTAAALTGTNIMFGHSDPTAGTGDVSPATDWAKLMFTLIDNVRVEQLPSSENANFDGAGTVDGADFLTWQKNAGKLTGALPVEGDANSDGAINDTDLGIWRTQFGTTPAALANAGSVPEPATGVLAAMALLACGLRKRGSRA